MEMNAYIGVHPGVVVYFYCCRFLGVIDLLYLSQEFRNNRFGNVSGRTYGDNLKQSHSTLFIGFIVFYFKR